MKVTRKIIDINEELCDGCGQCLIGCAEGALALVNGKARVIADNLCDGLGACIGECPQQALKIIEREADEFDMAAVESHLAATNSGTDHKIHGCPSSNIQLFAPKEVSGTYSSTLSHWPVKIRLVPPNAPFLKNAELIVLADCAALAYPALHQSYLTGRAVLMGCPKFDDADDYINRFAQIFKTAGIRRIINLFMEVPCCSALPVIVHKAMEKAGVNIPSEDVLISRTGSVMTNRIK